METSERLDMRTEAFEAFRAVVADSLVDARNRASATAKEITEVDTDGGDGASDSVGRERLVDETAPVRAAVEREAAVLKTLGQIRAMCLDVRDFVDTGSLVELADPTAEDPENGFVNRVYIIPGGRGRKITVRDHEYTAYDATSPLGKKLWGLEVGEDVDDPSAVSRYTALRVRSVI